MAYSRKYATLLGFTTEYKMFMKSQDNSRTYTVPYFFSNVLI